MKASGRPQLLLAT